MHPTSEPAAGTPPTGDVDPEVMEYLRTARKVFDENKTLTLISRDNGNVWAGKVYFAEQDGDLWVALEQSRNFRNIEKNPRVFFVIERGVPDRFIQGEGVAEIVGPVESGTGKEVVARTLYRLSSRRDRPFVKVNCAALPSELLESELFGFERGAFTGAQRRKLGRFEYANHGTIFLDEISEMPPGLQAKLLSVLQDGEFSRLGGETDVKVDTRVIAATNRNLEEAVREGSFREDLYYRLNVVTLHLPPLRERRDSIPLLVDHFLRRYTREYGKRLDRLSPETLDAFMRYSWPGNVRELENMVKRMVVLGSEETVLEEIALRAGPLPDAPAEDPLRGLPELAEGLARGERIDLKAISKRAAQLAERRVIERVLEQTRWNRKEAAARLQISYKALLYKMKEGGLSDPR